MDWTSIIKVIDVLGSCDLILFVCTKFKDLGNPECSERPRFFRSLILKDDAIKTNKIVIKTYFFFEKANCRIVFLQFSIK